jgi:predicted hydrocarbon binding protein
LSPKILPQNKHKYCYIIQIKEAVIKQKTKLFRVGNDTGTAFNAVAELLNVSSDDLLEKLMKEYISSVQEKVVDVAQKYPVFEEQYPFVAKLHGAE